jgi:hypothetical protein
LGAPHTGRVAVVSRLAGEVEAAARLLSGWHLSDNKPKSMAISAFCGVLGIG